MANPDHVARLVQGIEAWNSWRDQADQEHRRHHPTWPKPAPFRPRLSGINFWDTNSTPGGGDGSDLFDADISGGNFSNTELAGAKGVNVCVHAATFRGADLQGVDFRGSSFADVDLSDANLADASLRQADLRHVNLTGAVVTNLDLAEARIGNLVLVNIDLQRCKGLEVVKHNAPSCVSTESLAKSQGRIPEAFLRGCGLSDWEIATAKLYDPLLREDQRTTVLSQVARILNEQPIKFESLFISFSTTDKEFARKLYGDLQRAGVRCWFAPHDIEPGKKLHDQLNRAIYLQDRLLLILSEASMTSNWVATEISTARKREEKESIRMLFPILLTSFDRLRAWECFDADTGKDSAREVREYYVPDFSQWREPDAYTDAFGRLLEALRPE